jgi:uncharacterized protein
MSLQSALYVGSVIHRRLAPRRHEFRYRVFWLLIDLDELPALAATLRFFSRNRFNFFSLYDADHGDGSTTPLRIQVERLLADARIDISGGAIRLLCMPRTLGYSFNPISIYFCHRADGTMAALLYEVHNTFGDRHSYLIPVEAQSGLLVQRASKVLHVSPFMDMDMRYDFRVARPGARVAISIGARDASGPVLATCLAGARKPLADRTLMQMFLTLPAITLKVIAAIHWEALRLWLKGLRLHHRPAASGSVVTVAPSGSRNPD